MRLFVKKDIFAVVIIWGFQRRRCYRCYTRKSGRAFPHWRRDSWLAPENLSVCHTIWKMIIINQSIINQSIHESTIWMIYESTDWIASKPASQPASQSIRQTVSQSDRQSVNQTDSQSIRQTVSQSDRQSVSQTGSQPASQINSHIVIYIVSYKASKLASQTLR